MLKKNNYEELAVQILACVGGKDNISYLAHCATRLRFNLKDRGLAKLEEIKEIKGLVGCQWSNDQLQIIVGTHVAHVYNTIVDIAGLKKEDTINENLDLPESKKKISIGLLFETISGCVLPVLPAIIGAGMLQLLCTLGSLIGFLPESSPTYEILSFASSAAFYFLPVFIGASAAKKFNTNMGLALLLGAMIIYPGFIENVSAGTSMSIFGLPIYAGSYAYSIFPIIIAVYIMKHVERFFQKIIPGIVHTLVVPTLTLLVMVPATFVVIAPLGAFIGNYLIAAIMGIYNTVGFLGVAIISSLLPFLILTGMHVSFLPYMMQAFATLGYEPILGATGIFHNYNQGVAGLIVALKTKDKDLKSLAIAGSVSAFSGICEPIMFGVNLKLKTPLYAVMIGNFCAGLYAGIMQVKCYVLGAGGSLFAITAFISDDIMNLVHVCIAFVIGLVTTTIAALILYRNKEPDEGGL